MAGSVDRLKGTVKWFDSRRGFGFIAPVGGGQDIFVHHSSIKAVGLRSLTAGQAVEFVVAMGDDGRSSAESVTCPGGACIQVRRYFSGGCFHCKKAGHMARDCKSNRARRVLGSCHRGREIQTNLLNSLKLGSLSPLPDVSETLVGQLSKEQSDDNEPKSGAEWRNWAELPRDILLIIFKKIAAGEILWSAQSVCRSWRQLSHEPALWKCIDLRTGDLWVDMKPMAMMAVDRSEGCVEELYMEYFLTNELLHYIAERATRLRSLHLVSVYIFNETLVETLRKLPLLEELEITRCSFPDEVLEQVGQACPQLKSFRFDSRASNFQSYCVSDFTKNVGALAIAKHFKQLRRLHLFANRLTSIGLSAILENCPHLEYLDIHQCFNVILDESLKKKCARIKDLRFPNNSIADYEYWVDEFDRSDSDFNPHLSDTDYDYRYWDDRFSDWSDYDDDLF